MVATGDNVSCGVSHVPLCSLASRILHPTATDNETVTRPCDEWARTQQSEADRPFNFYTHTCAERRFAPERRPSPCSLPAIRSTCRANKQRYPQSQSLGQVFSGTVRGRGVVSSEDTQHEPLFAPEGCARRYYRDCRTIQGTLLAEYSVFSALIY